MDALATDLEPRPQTGRTPLVELAGVTKIYGRGGSQVRALDGVDLRIDSGEFVAIMGPSGSGKSTAMNIIGCLDTPTGGVYRFMGVELGGLDRNQRALIRRNYLGFVFQGFNLLARTTALENVELPLVYRGVAAKERRELALKALGRVGLAERFDHTSAELSGGQQQRVAIARAIVTEPSVLLADEPTGNLDPKTSDRVFEALLEIVTSEGLAALVATHDSRLARRLDRVIVIRDQKLVEVDHSSLDG